MAIWGVLGSLILGSILGLERRVSARMVGSDYYAGARCADRLSPDRTLSRRDRRPGTGRSGGHPGDYRHQRAPGVARLARSLALDIQTRDYIRAAETRAENVWFIMFREILPNARGPLLVDAMLRVGYAIFMIGTLGFLGVGLPPPDPDWGSMVNEARKYIFVNQLAVIWPALSIATLVIGLNLFADGLREELTRYQK